MKTENEESLLSRRAALKAMVAIGSGLSVSSLPDHWEIPVIEAGVLPAHAQTSPVPQVPSFRVALVRQLTPCENRGKHHIFIKVQDAAGQGINDVTVKISWGDGPDSFVLTRTQTHSTWAGPPEPGWVVFAMFRGTYDVMVMDGDSEIASGLTPDYGVNEPCGEDENANSLYHVSFEVVFVRE